MGIIRFASPILSCSLLLDVASAFTQPVHICFNKHVLVSDVSTSYAEYIHTSLGIPIKRVHLM